MLSVIIYIIYTVWEAESKKFDKKYEQYYGS